MARRITTVILDFGGVLTLPQDPERAAEMARLCNLSAGDFRREYTTGRLELDRGSLSAESYWSRILAAGGVPPSARLMERLLELDVGSWIRINPCTLGWSRELRAAGVRTAILSNMPPRILALMRVEPSLAWMGEFAVALFSCDVGMVKPEPAFYRLCLERLGAQASECVFFDDNEENARAGAALGMASFVFTTGENAARDAAGAAAHLPVRSLVIQEAS